MENVLGPPIGVFLADDFDSGENAKIIYSLDGGNESGMLIYCLLITILYVLVQPLFLKGQGGVGRRAAIYYTLIDPLSRCHNNNIS